MNDFDRGWKGDELLTEIELKHSDPLPPAFIAKHTRFANLGEMLTAAQALGIDARDLEAPSTAQRWSAFVAEHSDYPDWPTMLQTALDNA